MIWFDLDNSPHVPIFRPILNELRKREYKYTITARDFAQTAELLRYWKIDNTIVGRHAGKSKIKKILNLPIRAFQLNKSLKGKKIDLAVSHGSRTQLIMARTLGLRSIVMMDYEFTEKFIFNTCATYILIPSLIPISRLKSAGINTRKVIRYNGFKEELYLSDFIPDPSFKSKIGIENDLLVFIRPPSMVGNYHDSKSETLLLGIIDHFLDSKNTTILISARTEHDKHLINRRFSGNNRVKYLEKVVDGLQLLYAADIAISGGGTMNREAALLGTDTYSIFTGRRPYLDEYLQGQGKLSFIESLKDISLIKTPPKKIKKLPHFSTALCNEVTDIILDIATAKPR
ncbi:MAG: DUF354 domain-containing protein [Bacteroidota bacterium]